MKFSQPRRPHPSPAKALPSLLLLFSLSLDSLFLTHLLFVTHKVILFLLMLNIRRLPPMNLHLLLPRFTNTHPPYTSTTHPLTTSSLCQHHVHQFTYRILSLVCIFMYSSERVAISRLGYSWQLQAITLVPSRCHPQVTLTLFPPAVLSAPRPFIRQGEGRCISDVWACVGVSSVLLLLDADQGVYAPSRQK
ncbi:hypothetical protein E2C01_047470 [Portunus trituberculatus]|uniref:Uncharacterized protein n=1 Tax=Portunus trituberculatus TaxID=210409 RepID=A0A5B7G810_PORTR|nr:hypothetical protein [Portunus trituberculatus]